jgi:hypothetical protein
VIKKVVNASYDNMYAANLLTPLSFYDESIGI